MTRRGNPPDIVSALLEADARDKNFFDQRDQLDIIAARMATPVRSVVVNRDEEHNAFVLAIEDQSHGYPRNYSIGVDFIASGEYRTLLAAFSDIRDVTFPVVVKGIGAPADEAVSEGNAGTGGDGSGDAGAETDGAETDGAETDGAETDGADTARAESVLTGRQTGPGGRKDAETSVDNVDAFVEFFIAAGKKGIAVNRYKGLGEMNPGHPVADDHGSGQPDAAPGSRRGSCRGGSDVHDADG